MSQVRRWPLVALFLFVLLLTLGICVVFGKEFVAEGSLEHEPVASRGYLMVASLACGLVSTAIWFAWVVPAVLRRSGPNDWWGVPKSLMAGSTLGMATAIALFCLAPYEGGLSLTQWLSEGVFSGVFGAIIGLGNGVICGVAAEWAVSLALKPSVMTKDDAGSGKGAEADAVP
jgi:hypothetical protein